MKWRTWRRPFHSYLPPSLSSSWLASLRTRRKLSSNWLFSLWRPFYVRDHVTWPHIYSINLLLLSLAFSTRLFAVLRFESVIHEFDPYVCVYIALAFEPHPLSFRYFNFRTTRFLTEEGFYQFHNWFDDRAWYPLGRIIGGTIYPGTANLVPCSIHLYKINAILLIPDFSFYSLPLYLSLITLSPGLMVTSAGIYHVLHALNVTIEIRNVCVFLAPLFSSLTVIATYHLTKELKVCACTYMYYIL